MYACLWSLFFCPPSIALTAACRGRVLFPRARNRDFASARYSRPMSSVLSIAASGMAAAQKRLEVSARNVANGSALPSDEAFAALRRDQVEISGGGTAAVARRMPQRTEVDLAGEAVQLMVARYTFAANAKVARIAGEMQKALLDVTA